MPPGTTLSLEPGSAPPCMKLNFVLLADLWGVSRQTSHQHLHSFCSRLVPNKGQLSGERLRRGRQQGDARLRGDKGPKIGIRGKLSPDQQT